jgi:hypothetical protein
MDDEFKYRKRMRELIDQYRKEKGIPNIADKKEQQAIKRSAERRVNIGKSSSMLERNVMEYLRDTGKTEGIPKEGLEALEKNKRYLFKNRRANPPPERSILSPLHFLESKEQNLKFESDAAKSRERMKNYTSEQLKGAKAYGLAALAAHVTLNELMDPRRIATDEEEMEERKRLIEEKKLKKENKE